MATIFANPNSSASPFFPTQAQADTVSSLRFMVPLGRVFFSIIFILSGFSHFSAATISYAAAQGVPMASFLVPLSGLMAILGGLMIALGYKTRLGALLIILFLIPVTLMMHNFWSLSDPAMAQMQRGHFLKNMGLLGGACLLFYFGAGPVSMDERGPLKTSDARP